MWIGEQNERRTFWTRIQGIHRCFGVCYVVAYVAIQSDNALNVCYTQCCADPATAFRATLRSRWVLHISSVDIGKVTVSYEGERFSRKA